MDKTYEQRESFKKKWEEKQTAEISGEEGLEEFDSQDNKVGRGTH